MANTIPGVSVSGESAIGIGGALLAVITAILHFRRKASRDGVEVIKDRTEGMLVETLMRERDASKTSEREAWTKVNELSVINARQEEKIRYQGEEIERLKKMVESMEAQFMELKTRLQQLSAGATGHTGPAPLA